MDAFRRRKKIEALMTDGHTILSDKIEDISLSLQHLHKAPKESTMVTEHTISVPCLLTHKMNDKTDFFSLCLPENWILPFWHYFTIKGNSSALEIQTARKGSRVAGIVDWVNVRNALDILPPPETFRQFEQPKGQMLNPSPSLLYTKQQYTSYRSNHLKGE